MMAAAAPVAVAQTATQPIHPISPSADRPADADRPATASRMTEATFTTQSGELRAGQIIGSTVYDVQNRDVGSVKDIVLDKDGKVTAVVIDVGAFLGIGGKYVAVSLNDMKTDNRPLTPNPPNDPPH